MELWKILTIVGSVCGFLILSAIVVYFLFFKKSNSQIKQLERQVPFKIELFINYLGKVDNILKATASLNRIKITVKDVKLVEINKIKKMKQKGIIKQSNAISIIFGNYASALATIINDRLE